MSIAVDGNTTDAGAAFDALLRATTGALDARTLPANVPELDAIAKRTRKALAALTTDPRGLHLKASFAADGGSEQMWIKVQRCGGDTCTGSLENNPISVPKLARGDVVTVSFDDVLDSTRELPDGGTTLAESAKILERR